MDLKACLESVGPYNIMNQPVNKDTMDVIISYLETFNKIAIDVENTYIGENDIIDMELVKIYLNDIYTILSGIQSNPNITNALDALSANYPKAKYISLLTEITNLIISTENDFNISFYTEEANNADGQSLGGSIANISSDTLKEYLYTAKAFKQRKGTLSALKYGYNIIRQSGVQEVGTTSAVNDTLFNVEYGTIENPSEPFYFRITGSLIPEVYENAVVPIVHPLGFGYDYIRLMKLSFLELGLVVEQQSNYDVKIVCDNGATIYPIPSTDIINVKKEYDDFGDVKITVYLIDTATIAVGQTSSGYKIVRDFNSLVYLYDQYDNLLIDYPDYCALYTHYDIKYISGIIETETVDIIETYPIDILPEITESYFDIDVFCVGETYYIVTEGDANITTEQGDYNLITCL